MDQNQQPIMPETPGTPTGQPGHNLAIAALVLGIASVVAAFFFAFFGFVVGIALAIVGIILAVKAKKQGAQGGLCTAALVLSIIGTAINGIVFACVMCAACAIATTLI